MNFGDGDTEYYAPSAALIFLPRYPFEVTMDGSIRVRLDTAPEYEIQHCSSRIDAGECVQTACNTTRAILSADTVGVQEIPQLSYVPPFHPEYR